MVKRTVTAPNDEPEQGKFKLPSEGEHLFQVVEKWADKTDDNVIITKLEVAEGDEIGRSILHRVNLDSEWKGFFLTRLFLKAIGEPYKGEFEVDDDMWIGKCFYASVIHNKEKDKRTGEVVPNGKTYANIDQFNFDKLADNSGSPTKMTPEEKQKAIDSNQIAWDS